MTVNIGDRVNLIPPWDSVLPYTEGGYQVVAVTPFIDGITQEVKNICSIAPVDSMDFSEEFVEVYVPPPPPE